jgi:hypothetical protein
VKPSSNDIFRLVSLRGAEPTYTVDPTEDVEDSDVVRVLTGIDVDPANPSPEVIDALGEVRTLSADELAATVAARVDAALHGQEIGTLADLRAVRVALDDDTSLPVDQVPMINGFHGSLRAITDSWLKLMLTDPAAPTLVHHVAMIRAAHLCIVARRNPDLLNEPGALGRAIHSRVVPPRTWRPAARREATVREWRRTALEATKTVGESDRVKAVAEARDVYSKLEKALEVREAIRRKAHRTYFAWKRGRVEQLPPRPLPPRPGATVGWFRSAFGTLFGRVGATTRSMATPRIPLDEGYFADLDRTLTEPQRETLAGSLGAIRPDALGNVLDLLDPGSVVDEANRLCHRIRIWEQEEHEQLPVGTPTDSSDVRPLLRAIGWGDLVVARERLVGYDAREIAHIENIMPGEAKLREHEKHHKLELVTEVETARERESENDLQTTDRFELQTESQTTIQQNFSIEAGVNTSGRYGLTRVDTSLQAGFQQNKTDARASSQQVAQEIVSKAVDRTLERVRELRRETVTDQIRELNRHQLKNRPGAGDGMTPASISGIYVWVEKLMEVELRQYGTRMLVEFHIPEPAVSLLERGTGGPKPRKPAPFTLSPADVTPTNYLCLTERFGAIDVQAPPAQYIEVGFAWASAPSEDVDEDTAEDTVADTIAIPDGYRPVDGYGLVSAHPAQATYFDVFMAVGGIVVVDQAGVDFDDGEIEFDAAVPWPNGVPVSVRAHGHFDKTLVAQVTLRCERTHEAVANWKLRTWEQLRNAHEVRMQGYRNELDEQALRDQTAEPVFGESAEVNRRIADEELRKWAIKAMRLAPFNFNAIESVGDFQEVDPSGGDLQAGVARLFEEAFEWSQASYFLYPYYWSRRATWKLRQGIDSVDARHAAFLRAGSARYIVPVTPGYEARILYYLEADPTTDELTRLDGPPSDDVPIGSALEDLWLELLLDRKADIALGSGTLSVQTGQAFVTINGDSTWQASARDLGREVYVDGERYTIAATHGPQQIEFDESYAGQASTAARYATGSVPYGPPWLVRLPTSLVILADKRPDLAPLGH